MTECVDSIVETCIGIEKEIIVSSNSHYPKDKQSELVIKFPQINWIFNNRNGGFAYGMNSGLKRSKGDILITMNPDARISTKSIKTAIEFLLSRKDVGMIGPRIIDNNLKVQDSCRPFMSISHFFKRSMKRLLTGQDVLLEKEFHYEKTQSVDWVIGAFMMVKRDAFKKVGCLDENYFLYVEDMDWCMRFWKRGYKVVYFPELQIIYKGDRKSTFSVTEGKISRYVYYHMKSYMRFLMKFGPFPKRPKQIIH